MTRQEFIVTLRDGLKKLPPEEIVAATEYFEEYFDEVLESGNKTEEEIVEELGNPKRIAAQIRADYAARLLDGDESLLDEKPTVRKKISAAWWVVIGVVSAPVSIPIAICGFCILLGVICFIIGIIAGIIGVAAAGIGSIVFGCIAFADAVSSGLMILGVGLVLIAAAAAAGVGTFLGIRAGIRAIAKAGRRSREKRRLRRLADMSEGASQWVYASQPDPDEKAFMQELAADAAETGNLTIIERGEVDE